jgi:uncharacterized membrane protein
MRRALRFLAVPLMLLFPLALWLGEGRVAPAWLAALLLLVGLARLPNAAAAVATRYWAGGTILLALLAYWSGALLPLRFYPVLVNGAFLTVFAYSLIVPPSTIERLARLQDPILPPVAIAYTRAGFQMWCVFLSTVPSRLHRAVFVHGPVVILQWLFSAFTMIFICREHSPPRLCRYGSSVNLLRPTNDDRSPMKHRGVAAV